MKPAKLVIAEQPREVDPAPAAAVKSNGASKSAAKLNGKVSILMVDDRPDKLLALEAILGTLGQNLVRANSGKEALRLLLKQEFAVILMDVSMPGMDGFETAGLIRRRPATEHTPIIFVTSIGNSPSQMYQGYSLGAVDYILTPIVPEVLRAKVSVFVDLWRKTEQIKQQAERLREIEEIEHQRRLAEAVDRLEAETKRNRFFTLALDLLGIGDFNGRLLQVNPTWQKVLGYTEDELKNIHAAEFVHPEDRSLLVDRVAKLKLGESVDYFEIRCRRKDGAYRWLGWTAAPFPAEQLIYIFGRDITPQKEAEQQISKLNGELAERVAALTDINRELEAFNYSISHDLRAPLRSMGSFAQALVYQEEAKLTPQSLDYAKRIIRSAKYMDNLLQDLLTYSRVARAEMPLAPIQLEESVNEVLAQVEAEIREKKVDVEIKSPLHEIAGHSPMVKQILLNLIGNSLKFTAPERPPQLRIWTEEVSGDKGQATRTDDDAQTIASHPSPASVFVRLWIEDNGIGIAAEHHQKIFGLFERLHDAQTYPGTGVGLALVRKGAERMGGRAGLESQVGRGSRFWVDFLRSHRDHGK